MVRNSSSANPKNHRLVMNRSGGEETNIAMQQAANGLDLIRRSS